MSVNTFESRIGNFTITGRAHSLAAWFVLSLRLVMGVAFTYAGLEKVLGGFASQGYLANVAATNGNPLMWMFEWMATTPWFVAFVDVAVPWGELAVGLALIVGLATRLAAFFGAFMMAMFYFGNWSIEHGLINGDFAYVLVFLTVAALGAGRILGLDALVENYGVGGERLVERYPALDYVLG